MNRWRESFITKAERTERQEERLSIINNLVGNIEGFGETNIDEIALANIDFAYVIFDE